MTKQGVSSVCTYGRTAIAFQGGGALGAYHVGVFKAITEKGYRPDVLSGISIGGFLAAIIAGNPDSDQIPMLDQFWQKISWPGMVNANNATLSDVFGKSHHWFSTLQGLLFGQPNFFVPHLSFLPGKDSPRGLYDVTQLRSTLESLIDFDYLNSGTGPRLILGATRIRDGALVYFDSDQITLTVDHIMACGALPPVFPPIPIDDELYWDGGCLSNNPLEALFDTPAVDNTLCFVSDLYSPSGVPPESLEDVLRESKEIHMSSRTRHHLEKLRDNHNTQKAIHHLLQSLPLEKRQDPVFDKLKNMTKNKRFDVVHVAYGHKPPHEMVTADQEFSRLSLGLREKRGYDDMSCILNKRDWETCQDPLKPCQILSYCGPAPKQIT